MRRYLRDPTFSRFDTILECDEHTHTQTDRQTDRRTDTRRRHIPRLARSRAVKKMPIIESPFAQVAVDLVGPIYPATDRKKFVDCCL